MSERMTRITQSSGGVRAHAKRWMVSTTFNPTPHLQGVREFCEGSLPPVLP